jgi:1,2-diacylglycerol 3-alpha-glucosyltransferase
MKIGIVTVWFECGAGYVSRQYRDLLKSAGHEVSVFARGGYFAKDDPLYNTPDVHWAAPAHNPESYDFNIPEFKKWIQDNELDIVFFNEQKWWAPIFTCRELGVKTGAYIDYYTKEMVPFFNAYDFLICNTKRHHSVFPNHPHRVVFDFP